MCEGHQRPCILQTAHQQQAEDRQQQQQWDSGSLVEGCCCRVVFTKSLLQEQMGLRTDACQKGKKKQGHNSSVCFFLLKFLIYIVFFCFFKKPNQNPLL